MNYRSYNDLSSLVFKNIGSIRDLNPDLIVGIPRSGMIPAYMVGLHMNLKVCTVQDFLANTSLSVGSTRKAANDLQYPQDAKKVLLIDDSISSGSSLAEHMMNIPTNLKEKITTMAVYSDVNTRSDVDIFLEVVKLPRAFEWNIFHRDLINYACFDIDGVLCKDPEIDDDGERYEHFLETAKLHILPTTTIGTLVTNRLEKYRSKTEEWLHLNGIQYNKLVMLDLESKEQRQNMKHPGFHKAEYYSNSTSTIFIESDIEQAIYINEVSGKPVFCTDENIMINSPLSLRKISSSSHVRRQVLSSIKAHMPERLRNIVLPLYRKYFVKTGNNGF